MATRFHKILTKVAGDTAKELVALIDGPTTRDNVLALMKAKADIDLELAHLLKVRATEVTV